MSKIKSSTLLIITLCAIAIGACAWFFFKPKAEQPQYITETVTRGDIENTVLATGTLDATRLISVGSQASGQIKKMYVQLGDEVKQGQLIAQIDSTTQENSLKTADANIKNLEAQHLQQEAILNEKRIEFNRQKQMYAQDATSKAELDSAETAFKTAQAQIKALDAQIESARITRSTAHADIGYTQIVAPTNGTVVAIVTEEGQTVNAMQSAPTIIKIAKLQNMTIKAQVSEADIMKVEKGQQVYFTTLGDDRKRYATLRQIEPAPDSISSELNSSSSSNSSSTNNAVYYNALFDVPNEDGKLRIDMTAQVYIILDAAKNTLLIPSSTLLPTLPSQNQSKTSNLIKLKLTTAQQELLATGKATLNTVRILHSDQTTQTRQVLIGLNNRISAQVLAGLKEGDQVIIADSSDNSAAFANSKRRGPMRI